MSLNTVSKAFMALERQGYIVTRHGSGAYVRGHDQNDERISEIDIMTEDYVRGCLERGMELEDIPRFVSKAMAKFETQRDGDAGAGE